MTQLHLFGTKHIEAYRLTGNESYRPGARISSLLNRRDSCSAGGQWNEDEKISRNRNSNKAHLFNGYTTHFLLQYYTICTDGRKRQCPLPSVYSWINQPARSDDGCY